MHMRLVKPEDPRDPPHMEEAPYEGLPVLGHSEPIHIQAFRGRVPSDICAACGEPTELHRDTTGVHFVGCLGVPARRRLADLTRRPLGLSPDSSDPYPHVSRAIGDVLRVGVGPQLEGSFELLSFQERLDVERRIAAVAVAAFKAGPK